MRLYQENDSPDAPVQFPDFADWFLTKLISMDDVYKMKGAKFFSIIEELRKMLKSRVDFVSSNRSHETWFESLRTDGGGLWDR